MFTLIMTARLNDVDPAASGVLGRMLTFHHTCGTGRRNRMPFLGGATVDELTSKMKIG